MGDANRLFGFERMSDKLQFVVYFAQMNAEKVSNKLKLVGHQPDFSLSSFRCLRLSYRHSVSLIVLQRTI